MHNIPVGFHSVISTIEPLNLTEFEFYLGCLSMILLAIQAEQVKLNILFLNIKTAVKSFSVWCPLKGHTYLNKPAVKQTYRFV